MQLELNQNVIKLRLLSEKIRISQQAIIETLLSAGFVVPKNNPDIFLTQKQLEVIALAYVKSVKNFHKKIASSYKNKIPRKDLYLKRFFVKFIESSVKLTFEEIINAKLESKLIEEFFYDVIFAYNCTNNRNDIYSILISIKFRVLIIVKYYRTRVYVNVISGSTHIYPDEEEDHNSLANLNHCFSFVYDKLREASINTIIYLKPIKWIKFNYL